jgi:hypothetical protein
MIPTLIAFMVDIKQLYQTNVLLASDWSPKLTPYILGGVGVANVKHVKHGTTFVVASADVTEARGHGLCAAVL